MSDKEELERQQHTKKNLYGAVAAIMFSLWFKRNQALGNNQVPSVLHKFSIALKLELFTV